MTLVVSVNGPESIWLLADRRLTYAERPPRDDARKVMFLDTTDGTAILGYAGLGATALGTEPADWMSAVLRGRSLSLEQSLAILSEALKREMPRHLVLLPGHGGPTHSVVVTAFVAGEARLYTIDLAFTPDRARYSWRYTRHVREPPPPAPPMTPRLAAAGSGALVLTVDTRWQRALLRLVRANDRGLVTARAVADHLAILNNDVSLQTPDGSVGAPCIVAWRHRKGGAHAGGGGHQFYTGTVRDASSPSLPTIANGMDLNALAGVMMPHLRDMLGGIRAGERTEELDKDKLNSELAKLPDTPDETLR